MIAYAPFAHGNDLGNGLVVYPVWAVSAALLTLIATIVACNADARETCCFEEKSRRPFKKSRIREVFFFSGCYNGHVTSRRLSHAGAREQRCPSKRGTSARATQLMSLL